jgi:cytochrome b
MPDIEDLRKAVGAAAKVHKYVLTHPGHPPLNAVSMYLIWEMLEAELARQKEERDESSSKAS